jgi:hypothetical protein
MPKDIFTYNFPKLLNFALNFFDPILGNSCHRYNYILAKCLCQ